MLKGQLYSSDLSSREFLSRKGKDGFIGVLMAEGEEVELSAVLDKKLLKLTINEEGMNVEIKRVSKDLNYDFLKAFGKATNASREKIIGVWILKKQYKIENEEKAYSKSTGKDYMTAFNADGKYVIDIRITSTINLLPK